MSLYFAVLHIKLHTTFILYNAVHQQGILTTCSFLIQSEETGSANNSLINMNSVL
jgi:hypothetical protein